MQNPGGTPNRSTTENLLINGVPLPTRPRILITEDELVIAADLQRRLVKLGYEVVGIAVSGDDALLQVEDRHPDLVLMDIMLQGEMDGIAAAAAIRSRKDIPLIFLTANSDQQTRDRAGETKPFSYLLKPYKDGDLKFSIEMALYHHSVAQQLREAREQLEAKVAARTAELAEANGALREQIAQQARTMQELRATKLAAQSANIAKSEFLASISHELLTPMNGILGMTDLLVESAKDDDQREYADIVKMSAETLLSLLKDLLDFSSIESGRMILSTSLCGIREQVESYLRPLAHRAKLKGIDLRSKFSNDVPDTAILDPDRLGQVVIQLVGNAIKFTEKGEVCLEVDQLSCTAGNTHLHFVVRDTGIGVPPEKRETLFEPFSVGDGSTRRRHSGVGLGLAIASNLVELMGGEIWYICPPSGGSEFHFTICARSAEV